MKPAGAVANKIVGMLAYRYVNRHFASTPAGSSLGAFTVRSRDRQSLSLAGLGTSVSGMLAQPLVGGFIVPSIGGCASLRRVCVPTSTRSPGLTAGSHVIAADVCVGCFLRVVHFSTLSVSNT